jgi:predicted nucleic acid-binding protein
VTVVVDSDVLSELSRGRPAVVRHVEAYLAESGRLTVSAVTVFERLRGYRIALRAGKPFEPYLAAFEAFLQRHCVVLPVDEDVARSAAELWATAGTRERNRLGDLLIAATAIARGCRLATRNRKDYATFVRSSSLELVDWSR